MDSHATGPPADTACGVSPDALADALRLPAHQESLPPLRDLALAWAARAGLADESVQRLDLVLEEMLMNIFHHAYPGELGDVELSLVSGQDGVSGQGEDRFPADDRECDRFPGFHPHLPEPYLPSQTGDRLLHVIPVADGDSSRRQRLDVRKDDPLRLLDAEEDGALPRLRLLSPAPHRH